MQKISENISIERKTIKGRVENFAYAFVRYSYTLSWRVLLQSIQHFEILFRTDDSFYTIIYLYSKIYRNFKIKNLFLLIAVTLRSSMTL